MNNTYNAENQRKYRAKNKGLISEKNHEYYLRNKEKIEKYRELNKTQVLKTKRACRKRAKDNLGDSYIVGLLTQDSILTAKDIPEDLIELTRARLLIKRGLKDVKENK